MSKGQRSQEAREYVLNLIADLLEDPAHRAGFDERNAWGNVSRLIRDAASFKLPGGRSAYSWDAEAIKQDIARERAAGQSAADAVVTVTRRYGAQSPEAMRKWLERNG